MHAVTVYCNTFGSLVHASPIRMVYCYLELNTIVCFSLPKFTRVCHNNSRSQLIIEHRIKIMKGNKTDSSD